MSHWVQPHFFVRCLLWRLAFNNFIMQQSKTFYPLLIYWGMAFSFRLEPAGLCHTERDRRHTSGDITECHSSLSMALVSCLQGPAITNTGLQNKENANNKENVTLNSRETKHLITSRLHWPLYYMPHHCNAFKSTHSVILTQPISQHYCTTAFGTWVLPLL